MNYFTSGKQERERERDIYIYIDLGDISIAPTWRAVAADKRIWDRWCQEELDIRMLCILYTTEIYSNVLDGCLASPPNMREHPTHALQLKKSEGINTWSMYLSDSFYHPGNWVHDLPLARLTLYQLSY